MAIFHCQAKAISRAVGRSATAAAAYRAGESIADERTGEVYDYEKKQGVEYKEIITPEGSQIARSTLWNLAEVAERRKDAKVAREWELALPSELTHEQRVDLACQFARKLVERYGVVADVCIHAPGREGDPRNHHAHILTTTRVYEAGALGKKTRVLDSPRTSGQEVEIMRQTWASLANSALEKAGHAEKIDARSLQAQCVGREPTHHLGPAATAMERRGIQTERGDLNRVRGSYQALELRTELAALEEQQQGISAARSRAKEWRETQTHAAAAAQKQREEAEKERERINALFLSSFVDKTYNEMITATKIELSRWEKAVPEERVKIEQRAKARIAKLEEQRRERQRNRERSRGMEMGR